MGTQNLNFLVTSHVRCSISIFPGFIRLVSITPRYSWVVPNLLIVSSQSHISVLGLCHSIPLSCQ